MSINDIPADLLDMFDDYIVGDLNEEGVARLNDLLVKDEHARRSFILYSRTHTDLYAVARANRASHAALNTLSMLSSNPESVEQSARTESTANSQSLPTSPGRRSALRTWLVPLATAAMLVVGVFVYQAQTSAESVQIAWIQNAQNCKWHLDIPPTGDIHPGRSLQLEGGLVEIGFESGASIILQGPATLDLLTAKSARLRFGKLAAKVPKSAHGFTILSPEGKIIDLGTEFVMSVARDGATEVYVDKGEVQALGNKGDSQSPIHVKEKEGILLADGAVSRKSQDAVPTQFIRQITLPPIYAPRTLTLDFKASITGSIADADGLGTGLTHRLPGTGKKLLQHDANLKLDTEKGQLVLTTTDSDVNRRYKLEQGEYLGFRLSDFGFTGTEDFSIAVTIPEIPELAAVGQFGLFAGTRNDCSIRGGLIRDNAATAKNSTDKKVTIYQQFMANNNGGNDSNGFFVGLYASGEDMQMTLRRTTGKFYLTVGNHTGTNTIDIKHPEFLDGQKEMFLGLYGANTQSNKPQQIIIKRIEITVWEQIKSAPLAMH